MDKGTRVVVKGTTLKGEVVSTRLMPASKTGKGLFGDVKMVTVQHDGYQMEYEWTELKQIEDDRA